MTYVPINVGENKHDTRLKDVEDTNLEDLNLEHEEAEEQEQDVEEQDVEDTTDSQVDDTDEGDSDEGEGNKQKPKSKEKPKQPVNEDKDKKRTSRAQKRIKELVSTNKELESKYEQETAAMRAEMAALKQQLNEGTKQSKTSMKQTLEGNLKHLTKSLREAMENGDADAAVQLQDEMMTAKMELAGLDSELMRMEQQEKTKPKDEPVKQKPKQDLQDIPEKAMEWIDEHPAFKTDELFYVSAMTVSNQLVNEGFDDNSDDFYEELNDRLSTRFPEIFGTDDEDSVKYTKDSSKKGQGDVKDKQLSQDEDSDEDDVEVATQTVSSGGSRSPLSNKKKRAGKDTVTLSPEMVKQAERWGLSLEQMARRVAHSEKNKRTDGYVPIMFNK